MQFSRQKKVDFSRDLPAEIQTAYLRHSIGVQFEQYYMNHAQRTEPSLEDLEAWCDTHCADIHSITKWAQNCVVFRFYLSDDMQRFESYLTQSVAHAAGSVT